MSCGWKTRIGLSDNTKVVETDKTLWFHRRQSACPVSWPLSLQGSPRSGSFDEPTTGITHSYLDSVQVDRPDGSYLSLGASEAVRINPDGLGSAPAELLQVGDVRSFRSTVQDTLCGMRQGRGSGIDWKACMGASQIFRRSSHRFHCGIVGERCHRADSDNFSA